MFDVKKIISLLLASMCFLFFASNTIANAYEWDYNKLRSEIRSNPEYKKTKDKAALAQKLLIDELFNGSNYSDGKDVRAAETSKIKVEFDQIKTKFGVIYSGRLPADLEPHIAFFYEGGGIFRIAKAPIVGPLVFKFTNKTDKVVKVDLDQCVLTINGTQQRPLRGNIRRIEEASAVQPPLIIAPHATITQEFWHATPSSNSYSIDNMYCGGYYLLSFDRETLGQQLFFDGDDYAILNISLIFNKDKLTHEKTKDAKN